MGESRRSETLLDVAEAAEFLRLSKMSVYRACASGRLPVVRLSPRGKIRIPASALEPK
jgi:excisionase family DNA binding protein